MHRLGIVSDSHGRAGVLQDVAEALSDCDAIAHLGDVTTDADRLRALVQVPVYAVRGNCDGFSDKPEEIVLTQGGIKLLLCHGHRYRVKNGLTALSLYAEQIGAAVVLYGHTHIPSVERAGRALFVNPGALMERRYAVLEWRENGPVPVMKIL